MATGDKDGGVAGQSTDKGDGLDELILFDRSKKNHPEVLDCWFEQGPTDSNWTDDGDDDVDDEANRMERQQWPRVQL